MKKTIIKDSIKETIRKQTIDRNLYQDAINEGYESIYFPFLYETNYSELKKQIIALKKKVSLI